MFKLPIDENTCILQAYFDGGDSYVGHEKYNVINKYKTTPENIMSQAWESARVSIEPNGKSVIERDDLNIDISDYDRFRISALTPDCVHVKLFCNDELVIDSQFSGKIEMLDGDIKTTQAVLKSIRYEFENSNKNPVTVVLHYLGMISDKPKNKIPYENDWEGFFAENPSCEMFDENLITKKELENLKERIKKEPYKTWYEKIRERAYSRMDIEPEKLIKRTVADFFREPENIRDLDALALVGQIENNEEMLKMACRSALSIGCCEYWCADPMETAPTVTWHHRSFTETGIAKNISTVISLAGNILSWHGRNFLYNMLIMKGLPRMEADFMTMDYIYKCNQGIAFMCGYVQALVTLSDRYPRYKRRLKEAKELLDEMLDNAFEEDGSTFEGAGYWHYTMITYLYSLYFLAKSEKKTLREYVGDKLDNTSDFGLSLLDEKGHMFVLNDCHPNGKYSALVSALLYSITEDERWIKVNELVEKADYGNELLLISSVDMPETDVSITSEFKELPTVGYTQVCREGIQLVASAGPSNDTHCHCDKGSFIIYKNGDMVVPDPSGAYNRATTVLYHKTDCHSLTVPVINGAKVEQLKGDGYMSVTKKASYENGVFEWQCDNSKLWDSDAVKKCIRTIYSDKPNEFIITDEFEFSCPARLLFRVNVMKEDALEVTAQNWKVTEETVNELCDFAEGKVYQICKLSEEKTSFKIETRIVVL